MRDISDQKCGDVGREPTSRASEPKNETLAGDNRAWPSDCGFSRDLIHKNVVVTRVVMKDHQGPNAGGIG